MTDELPETRGLDAETEEEPTPPSVEVVLAREVRRQRDLRAWTAARLAEEVAKHGGRLTRQAISKIENGDREVSFAEIGVLGRAFGVPPLRLPFPVGWQDEIGYPPKASGDAPGSWSTAAVLEWFTGESRLDGGDISADPGAAPLVMWRRHRRHVDEYRAAMRELATPFTPEVSKDDSGEYGYAVNPNRQTPAAAAGAAVAGLRAVRAEMRRLGLKVLPQLSEEFGLRKAVEGGE